MIPKTPKRTRRLRARAAAMNQHETDSEDYGPEPNMKLSHAFMVVLLLHVIVVGGLYAFNSMKVGKPSSVKLAKREAVINTSSSTLGHNESNGESSGNQPSASQKTPVDVKTTEAPKTNFRQESKAPEVKNQGLFSKAKNLIQKMMGSAAAVGSVNASTTPSNGTPEIMGTGAGTISEGTGGTNNEVQQSASAGNSPTIHPTKPYVVKSGDTITRIAASLGLEISDLEKANELNKNSVLRVGQPLKMPGQPSAPATIQPPLNPSLNPVSTNRSAVVSTEAESMKNDNKTPDQEYTVVKGDSPYRIAKKFKITPEELMKENAITDPKKIQIGQRLKIPSSNKKMVK